MTHHVWKTGQNLRAPLSLHAMDFHMWVTHLFKFISFSQWLDRQELMWNIWFSFLCWFLRQLKKMAFVTFVLQPNSSEYRQRGVTFWVARAQLLLGIMKISSALPSTLVREGEVCLWCAAVALPGIEREHKIHRNVIWWLVWITVIQLLLIYHLSRYFKICVLVLFFFNLGLCGAELIISRKDNSWTSKAAWSISCLSTNFRLSIATSSCELFTLSL